MKALRRNKGEGSIAKLGKDRYKVTVTLGIGIGSKQVRKSRTVKTKAEAVQALKDLNAKYRTPQAIKQELQADVTFAEYVEKYLERKEISVSKNTFKTYNGACKNHLLPILGSMLLKNITTSQVNDLLVSLDKQGLSGKTIQLTRVMLSNIMKEASNDELIPKNPVSNTIRVGKVQKKSELNLPTHEQLTSLLTYLKDKDYMSYVLVVLELATGLRKGELLGLKWTNVDFKKNIIHIKTQHSEYGWEEPLKTPSSYRSIHVEPEVLKLLQTLKEDSPIYICPMEIRAFSLRIRKYFNVVGFDKHITFHDLRHYHATELIRKGINIKVVSKRLGHSTINTTLDLYVHYLPSMDLEASKIMGKEYIV